MGTRYVGQLPPDAEADLKAAAAIVDPRERQLAIEAAGARARAKYPHLFKGTFTMQLTVFGRLAFPAIWEKAAFAGDPDAQAAFSAKIIIDPANKALVKSLDDAMADAAKAKWGNLGNDNKGAPKWRGILDKLISDGKVCFVHGEYTDKNGDVYDGFEDMFYLSCRGQTKPTVVDRDRSPLTKDDGKPYAGCDVNVIVDIYAQDNAYGRRINCSMTGVQFVRDGDAFAASAPAKADAFADLSMEEDESDLV